MKLKNRKPLPGIYEKKYKSEDLKFKIADIGMWSMIPGVSPDMNSQAGLNRLKENDPLFSFIDEYFPDDPYAFEPNMQDSRFMFFPDEVRHQGMGVCASTRLPGYLDIGHFWYPCEYTEKSLAPGQIYVPMFSAQPGPGLVEMIRKIYMGSEKKNGRYCTFPFSFDAIVTLEGNFLDSMTETAQTIRRYLRAKSPEIKNNGEYLIGLMQKILKDWG